MYIVAMQPSFACVECGGVVWPSEIWPFFVFLSLSLSLKSTQVDAICF